MTGMGKDGLLGIQEIKKQGGFCIAQDEESCVVYGMPKAIVDARLADIVSPLEKIPSIINKALVV
jgi:two-component system chemotaxis response regulator CheB